MPIKTSMIRFALTRPRLVLALTIACTLLLSALIVRVKVDTDPENMLSEKEAVRVFHHLTKKDFSLYDVVVLGVVNEQNPQGVFNPETLRHVAELSSFAAGLADPKDPARRVVAKDIIAPDNVDAIIQDGPGQLRFEWLMAKAPTTAATAARIRDLAMDNPLLKGTLVSEDGKALAIYLPITAKDYAYSVRDALLTKIKSFGSTSDRFHITGLPVAEDTFGVDMFVQMAISAPLAMLAIFLLMLLFFRKLNLIVAPMIVAMVSVLCTMGLFIGTGHTLHIMSSMIPIFLMPIAVVDSIHILSEFFDTYHKTRDRRTTMETVMGHLFTPMLYTSLTSAAGFASLATTPIPPVQSFGLFVACGIMLAWALTIFFVPAFVMLLPEKSLNTFGASGHEESHGALERSLTWLGLFTQRRAKVILAASLMLLAVSAYGISKIQINDNPVKWFKESHPIREADRVLNRHFGGTYEAYLVLEGKEEKPVLSVAVRLLEAELNRLALPTPVQTEAQSMMEAAAKSAIDTEDFLARAATAFDDAAAKAPDESYDLWNAVALSPETVKKSGEVFRRPDVLRYVEGLQNYLQAQKSVGKSNSVSDVVKKVHKELFASDPARFSIPATAAGVAQCLLSFQSSHKPDDLWHLVTPDFKKANIWLQLKSGDNKDMEKVVAAVAGYMRANPPPVAMQANWAGLTYINVVWQEKMVKGMLWSFASSFVIVLIMMIVLFRSFLWGMLSMIPLSVTIAFIYGVIGLVGKDYDMPVAVLSALTLGLAVDFAIHFLERSREAFRHAGSWEGAAKEMFAEPARAISRNVVVIAVGFTPLLLAPLVPYQTVGFFLASIMFVSGLATMFILPALVTIFATTLFKKIPVQDK